IHQLLVGSEGIFGIIIDAQLKVHKIPSARGYRGLLFKSFESGAEAIRQIAGTSIRPAVLRLSDMEETRISLALRDKPASFTARLEQDLGWKYLQRRGYRNGSLMLIGFEGDAGEVAYQSRTTLSICKRFGGFDLGTGPGQKWLHSRFDLPYLRDD